MDAIDFVVSAGAAAWQARGPAEREDWSGKPLRPLRRSFHGPVRTSQAEAERDADAAFCLCAGTDPSPLLAIALHGNAFLGAHACDAP